MYWNKEVSNISSCRVRTIPTWSFLITRPPLRSAIIFSGSIIKAQPSVSLFFRPVSTYFILISRTLKLKGDRMLYMRYARYSVNI